LTARAAGVGAGPSDSAADENAGEADSDALFLAADYARGFALQAVLEERLAARFGAAWRDEPAAGALLRDQLFSRGRALSADEVAARVGAEGPLDFAAAARRAERLFSDADALAASAAQVGRAEARP
jgi:hypothetical protein